MRTRSPFDASTNAAIPPPAPEPTITASYFSCTSASSPCGYQRNRSLQPPDADVAEPHRVRVVLQANVPLAVFREMFPIGELGFVDAPIPVFRTDRIFDDLLPVEPVFRVTVLHDEPRLVELTYRAHHVLRRAVQRVAGAGARLRHLAIDVPVIVQDLHFDAGFVSDLVAFYLAHAVEDSAVTALRQLPLQLQLEVLVL